MSDISIIIITYKSESLIKDFLKKIPEKIPVIIVENSNNLSLKDDIENNFFNVKVYLKDNIGVSRALNFAANKVITKYFLQISPDIQLNFNKIEIFFELAKILKDNFAAIGPRFLDVKEKSHKQIKKYKDYDAINAIHGSCMFIKKNCFEKIGGFDDNFFLYFEETEYCNRAKKFNLLSYQTNKVEVKSIGRSVKMTKERDEDKLSNLLSWHFVWSKFYFLRKNYNYMYALVLCLPLMIRTIIKYFIFKYLKKDKKNFFKYKYRLSGLFNSMMGRKSSLRID